MLNPVRHRNCSNMAALSNQINDGPVFFSPLDVLQAQLRQLSPTQTASE
jgi:hypothetical protein